VAIKKLAVLGSTGSVGSNTLDVVERQPELYQVTALAAARSLDSLAKQIIRHKPKVACVLDEGRAKTLAGILPSDVSCEVLHGRMGYEACATQSGADIVVSAMVGSVGLLPVYAALKAGIDVALANKETLVAAGELMMEQAKKTGAALLPVDSEHSAIFQSLMGNDLSSVSRLWLTASGGPFKDYGMEELSRVTPEQALMHPNWSMGPKITIDSATLMNKGLEVIEAHHLFNQPYEKVKVVIHPQSLVHSMVEYQDGSFIAQLGPPDMRLPIAFALTYPERAPLDLPTLNPCEMGSLQFREPDMERFPALKLAYQAGEAGGSAPCVLNAANEVAVGAFLAGHIGYSDIAATVAEVLERVPGGELDSLDTVLLADEWARKEARTLIEARANILGD
jgi:1-deoxy-D-xylulose-5-phosphate reductoisomerase